MPRPSRRSFPITSYGGRDSYWHLRASGDDPQRMLTTELLPLLAKRGLRTDRYGVLGWSIGGYGALLLAAEVGAPKVAAVGPESRRLRGTSPGLGPSEPVSGPG